VKDRHLITVDELRAAGALDVPAAWRKSLGVECVERDLFSDSLADDEPSPQQQQSMPPDPDCDESADELR
jgi:hypothetical protein